MIDLLIFCNRDDKDLKVLEAAKQFPDLRIETIFFNEGSTRLSIYPETDEIYINQFRESINIDAELYIYHPSFHDIKYTSLYDTEVDEDCKSYVHNQWQVITEYLEFYLEGSGKWINKPSASRRAKNKIAQISIAKKHGLNTPKTVITNDEKAVKIFFDTDIGIHKSISESGVINNDLVSRTSIFSISEIDEDSGLDLAPGCFQEFIDSNVELRTYVAGNSAITVAIEAQDKFLIPDIRSQPRNDELFSISSDFCDYEKKLIDLVRFMGLHYAAIDSIVTANGIKFLELNPNGSWEWLPQTIEQVVREFYWEFVLRCFNGRKS